jgi:hypothetical protein
MASEQPAEPRHWVVYQIHRSDGGEWHASKPFGVRATMTQAMDIAAAHAADYWKVRNLKWESGGGAKGVESYQATLPRRFASISPPWHSDFPLPIESDVAYVVERF